MNVESTTGLGSSAGLGRDEIYRVCEAGYNEVSNKIVHHPAMSELEKFGGIIFSRPLSRPEMALFFATIMGCFQGRSSGDCRIGCACYR